MQRDRAMLTWLMPHLRQEAWLNLRARSDADLPRPAGGDRLCPGSTHVGPRIADGPPRAWPFCTTGSLGQRRSPAQLPDPVVRWLSEAYVCPGERLLVLSARPVGDPPWRRNPPHRVGEPIWTEASS